MQQLNEHLWSWCYWYVAKSTSDEAMLLKTASCFW